MSFSEVLILFLYNVLGVDGFTTEEDQELLSRIEKQIKRRFIIGSQVSEHAIIQDFARQVIRGHLLKTFFLLGQAVYVHFHNTQS